MTDERQMIATYPSGDRLVCVGTIDAESLEFEARVVRLEIVRDLTADERDRVAAVASAGGIPVRFLGAVLD